MQAVLDRSAADRRIVWVLGAGFSVHLGGPVFRDVMSPAARTKLEGFMGEEISDAMRFAHFLYNWGTAFKYGTLDAWPRHSGQLLWPDAEVFVDTLETACERSQNSTVFRGIERALQAMGLPHLANEDAIKRLRDGARRLLAADCSAFLDGNESGERWVPYKRWLDQLSPNDVVISFNYDCVVEKIHGFEEKATVVLPGAPVAAGVQVPRVPLYKLHGSVDWVRAENDHHHIERTNERLSALKLPAERLVLGVPGPAKPKVATELNVLWEGALEALKKAHAIIFMGYRFPPTDSEALQKLLGAITQNEEFYLALHAVLGPGRSDDVVRMERLLEFAVGNGGRLVMDPAPEPYLPEDKRHNVEVQPLYAQDFSTLFTRSMVAFPYCWPPSTGVPI